MQQVVLAQKKQSQNHRMIGVGRDLCGSSSPNLPPKQGHLQQAAEDHVQAGLEYLQRRRLHKLPGQPNNRGLGKFVNVSTVIPNEERTRHYLFQQDKPKPGKLEAWI